MYEAGSHMPGGMPALSLFTAIDHTLFRELFG
jgi:hypothetical protein